jgi:hypothetical protein
MHSATIRRLKALTELHLGVSKVVSMHESTDETEHNLGAGIRLTDRVLRLSYGVAGLEESGSRHQE